MSDIECPYCGHDYDDDAAELNSAASRAANSKVDEECPECGKTFEVFVEWEAVYYPSKKE